jgi:hypothetical protein
MTWLISLTLVLHVLAATFWAGSTFTLARTGGKSAELLFAPQMGAAVVTVLAGGYLWARMFGGSGGHALLGLGAAAALLAALVQAVMVGRVLKRIPAEAPARAHAALAHRVAAGLLAITLACMVLG